MREKVLPEIMPQDFPQAPLDSVADDRSPEFFSDRKADPAVLQRVGKGVENRVSGCCLGPLIEDFLEVPLPGERSKGFSAA